jgi:hypothetical protein
MPMTFPVMPSFWSADANANANIQPLLMAES